MRKAIFWSGVCVLVFLWPTLIMFAQSDQQSVNVGFTILPYQSLSVSGGINRGDSAVSTVRVPQPQVADLNRGYIDQRNAVQLGVKSNIPWQVRVRTDDANMGQSFDRAYTKPISDFQLRSDGGRYLQISQEDQILAQGDFGEYSFGVDYRTHFNLNTHHEGRYQIRLIYTIVSR